MTPDHFDVFASEVWNELSGIRSGPHQCAIIAAALRTEWKRGNKAGQESMRARMCHGWSHELLPILDEEPTE